jgi:hypothetical protein
MKTSLVSIKSIRGLIDAPMVIGTAIDKIFLITSLSP